MATRQRPWLVAGMESTLWCGWQSGGRRATQVGIFILFWYFGEHA